MKLIECEAHTHLVEYYTRKDEEENKDVEESLGTLHRAERRGVPATFRLQQVFDRRQDVHEYV